MAERKTDIKIIEYPFNLISAVTNGCAGNEIIEAPSDLRGSVEYALCTLSEREREIILMRFAEGKTYGEIAERFEVTRERIRQLENKALKKLGHPSRRIYFTKGVSRLFEEFRIGYLKDLTDLQIKLVKLCKLNAKTADEVIEEHSKLRAAYKSDEIKPGDFSVRTYNCLARHGITKISKLATLSYDELMHIRNMGTKSVSEVMRKLKEYGYSVAEEEKGSKQWKK